MTTWRRRRLSVVGVMALSLVLATASVAVANSGTPDPTLSFRTVLCDADTDGSTCGPYDSFVDFTLRVNSTVGSGVSGTEQLSGVTSRVFDAASGTTTTTMEQVFGDDVRTGALTLTVVPRIPAGVTLDALQCNGYAATADAPVSFNVQPSVDSVACVLSLVEQKPVQPAPPVAGPAPAPPVVAPDTQVLGTQQLIVERDGQTVSVSGPSTGDIRLVFGADEDATIDATVIAACDVLVGDADGPVRLAPNVVVIDPSGFADGDEIEVSTVVPAAEVERATDWSTIATGDLQVGDVPGDEAYVSAAQIADRLQQIRANRDLPADPGSDAVWVQRILAGSVSIGDARTAISAKAAYWSPAAYGVCFAGEKADVGSLSGLPPLDGAPLFGPALLTVCTEEVGAPCVDDRAKDADGNVTIAYRIPAEDPWMR